MNTPVLSVVIPCFNQGAYLLELLDCFPNYHDQNIYELIIVDDGSSDEYTLSVFKELQTKDLDIIHQKNQGVCIARNVGISAAQGRYILPVDGDDKISVQFIYDAIDILDKSPEYAVVYANGEYFGAKTGSWQIGEFNLQRLMLWNYLGVSSVFRKFFWEKAGGFDPKMNGLEDWDFWLSIAFNGGKFYYLDKSLFQYRILSNSANRSLTPERYNELLNYLEEKHHSFLGKEHLSNHFVTKFKYNKKLWFKLFLKTYFPKYLNKLVASGKLDSENIN